MNQKKAKKDILIPKQRILTILINLGIIIVWTIFWAALHASGALVDFFKFKVVETGTPEFFVIFLIPLIPLIIPAILVSRLYVQKNETGINRYLRAISTFILIMLFSAFLLYEFSLLFS